jgi:hypothetical protein
MGALAFCHFFPFQIKAISEFPIIKKFLYEGLPISYFFENKKHIDYVVFPSGLHIDVYDNRFVWLTIGLFFYFYL